MKLILAVWQRKINYRRKVKKNWIIAVRRRKNQLSPCGEEKINYPREAKKKNIDYRREA
jgi:hypothetical protein